MPWSNQTGGGGWKSGGGNGGGPWGQGPGGGGGQQPDLEDMLKRSQDKMKRAMGGGGGGGGGFPGVLVFIAAIIGALVVAWYAFFFQVQPSQQGVVLRFGEHVRTEGEGLHFRYPYPIEQVYLVDTTTTRRVELGLRTIESYSGSATEQDVPEESLILTGDENIVDVDFVVQWVIKSVDGYLFNIQNPDSTVKEVAESVMREVVGKSNIVQLTEDRAKIEQDVLTLMQKTLDSYGAGVEVTSVEMKKADPPGKVIDAHRDVQAAKADQERLQNEAQAYANRIVPEARGAAERILQAAQGYRDQTVAEATGEAARFEKVYDEYRKAPDVTRKRIFLETMERVFKDTDKIILDGKGSGSGVVPYLPLNELTKPRAPSTQGGQ